MSDGPFATSCTGYAFRQLEEWIEEQDVKALRQAAQAVRSCQDGHKALMLMANAGGQQEFIEKFRRWKIKMIAAESAPPKTKDDREER